MNACFRSKAGASLDTRFRTSEDAGGVRLTVSAARAGDTGVYTLQVSWVYLTTNNTIAQTLCCMTITKHTTNRKVICSIYMNILQWKSLFD